MIHRHFLFAFMLGCALGVGMFLSTPRALADTHEMTVYKTPWCGCCSAWIKHMEMHGFEVTVKDEENLGPLKSALSVPTHLQSCHTAKVGNYVVEGHVPASDVLKLLEEQPDAVGIAVPGMPIGSPGMEMGSHSEAYEVFLFGQDAAGQTETVFSKH